MPILYSGHISLKALISNSCDGSVEWWIKHNLHISLNALISMYLQCVEFLKAFTWIHTCYCTTTLWSYFMISWTWKYYRDQLKQSVCNNYSTNHNCLAGCIQLGVGTSVVFFTVHLHLCNGAFPLCCLFSLNHFRWWDSYLEKRFFEI